ncbi:MAG: DUF370 domain-containing protein [Clostridia bacterium]|nr:DUF370 domain-containing protein [Clostridia bacterium]
MNVIYIHIGNNEILNREDIIAILDVEQLAQNRNNLRIINKYKERNNDKDQSVIVVEKDGKERFVFTNVAISTLRKRLSQENVYEYFIE